jgi:hypothetical protein
MMMKNSQLFLYEEIMLLALRDEQGTIATGFVEQAVAGAILAEMLLEGRISIGDSKKQFVSLLNNKTSGDPVIDECINKMSAARKPVTLQNWVHKLAGIKNLKHKVAQQLCERRILQADEDKVLFLFTRRIYPEINPSPERKIIERMRKAIFSDQQEIDARTVVLISLAKGSDLLRHTFGRKELKPRKERIEHIVNGDVTGKATGDVIAACQAALIVAAIMPAMISTTVNS